MQSEDRAELAKEAAAGQQRKAAATGDPNDLDQARRMQSAADRLADTTGEEDVSETQFDS